MRITPETQIAEIAGAVPGSTSVLRRYGIDFCCGGRRSLADVCAEQGLAYDEIRRELEAAAGPQPEAPAWDAATLDELIDHIVGHYHAGLRAELPRLQAMAAKVSDVHGSRHPDLLPRLLAVLGELAGELEDHMMKEELVLFPAIRQLAGADAGEPELHPAALLGPIRVMEDEHAHAGGLLAVLRQITRGYEPPPDACSTFRGLFDGLAELEQDLHAHIDLENSVLFPRALAFNSSGRGRTFRSGTGSDRG